MKYYFIIILLLLNLQANSYFTQYAICEKDGKYILLLGDEHSDCSYAWKQKTDLIEGLKKWPKESIVTLVESHNKNNVPYSPLSPQLSFLVSDSYRKKVQTLFELASELKEENINAIDIEYRGYMLMCEKEVARIEYEMGQNLLMRVSGPRKNPNFKQLHSISFEDTLNCSTDILEDFYKNLELVEQYKEEIRKSTLSEKSLILDYYSKEKKKIIESVYIELLEKMFSTTPEDYLSKSGYNPFSKKKYNSLDQDQQKYYAQFLFLTRLDQLTKKLHVDAFSRLLDIRIVHNMLTNKNKKIVVIATGRAHMSKIKENFLKKTGYTCIDELDVRDYSKKQYSELTQKERKLIAGKWMGAINIEGLFEMLRVIVSISRQKKIRNIARYGMYSFLFAMVGVAFFV